MKKMLFFIPAIIFTLFYGFIAITAIGAISPIVIGWLVLFIVAGILLSRTVFWGSLFGILPAIHLIYMSMQETGQVGNVELPLGIIALLFYVLCGCFVYKRRVAIGDGNTKNRIKNVLNYKKPAFWVIVVSVIAVVVAVFCLVSNPAGTTIQNPCVQEYIVGADGIIGSVDTEKYTTVSEDFAIGADKYGRAVFKEPHKAFATFETLYADAIELIKSENDLKLFSHKNYEMYKVYGWQLTGGSKEEQNRARFVSGFLDIYENSFEKRLPNTDYVEPTIEVEAPLNAMRPMIMVDGVLYLDTGKEVAKNVDSSAILGEITSAALASGKPTKNGQCNFNSGVGAKYATYEDGIAVFLEHRWFFFEEEADDTISAAYTMMKLGKNGEVLSSYSLKSKELADAILFDALSKSAAWEGVDVNTLEECYLIRKTLPETGEVYDYYAYHLTDGTPVLQNGTDGRYSALSGDLYLQLVDSFKSNGYLFFWLKPDEPPQLIGDTAANVWMKSFMNEQTPAESRISDYTITDVTVISGEPKKGTKWDDMAYQYVVQVTYNITTATEQYLAAADGISGKGSFQGLFRELCVKVKASDGGGFQIVAVGTGGGEQEFLKE